MPTIQQLVRKGRVVLEDKSIGFMSSKTWGLCQGLYYDSQEA